MTTDLTTTTGRLELIEGELRVRDLDAAAQLGFARPRKVRETIERIWPSGKRPHQRTVPKLTPTGGDTGLTLQEYWLTYAELLRLVSRCRTPGAEAQVDELLARFVDARRPDPRPDGAPDGATANHGEIATPDAAPQPGATDTGIVLTAPQPGALALRSPDAAPNTLAAEPWWPRAQADLRRARPRLSDATVARVGRMLREPLPSVALRDLVALARVVERCLDPSELDPAPALPPTQAERVRASRERRQLNPGG